MKQKLTIGLAIFYVIVRFFFTTWLETLSTYSSYIFEVILVSIMVALYWREFKAEWRLNKKLLIYAAISGIAGFAIFKLMRPIGVFIPFDLIQGNVWFFLIVIGPVLEEFIFRFFMWRPFAILNRRATWIITSVIFSYSHLHAIWFVAPDIHGFVYYQAVYTLGLGLACGYSVYKYQSLLGAILIHFLFNAGFFVGAMLV